MLDLVAVMIAADLLALTSLGSPSVLRLLLALAFVFYVPGRAIVTHWPRLAGWSAAAMPMVFSLALLGLAATVTLWAHYWHPIGLFQAEACLSLAALALGIARRHRPRLDSDAAVPQPWARSCALTESAIWVGVLDLDEAGAIAPVSGPLHLTHQRARLLVRVHGAPVGYVCVPTLPTASLGTRARAEAEATLSGALREHALADSSAARPGGSRTWAAGAACPDRYTTSHSPGITVVICTKDRTESLRGCLDAVRRVRYEPMEILVVDNAPSEPATKELVAELAAEDARIRYTCEPGPGLSKARNHGLAEATHDIVAFTDDDTLADPGWLAGIAAGLGGDPDDVCVTGLVAPSSLTTASERYFDARHSSRPLFEPRRYDLSCATRQERLYPFNAGIFGSGANFAVRRDAITSLGGFDPLLGAGAQGRGGEDLDMFLRVILAGKRICYVPTALIWHRHRADTQALHDQLYSYAYGLGAYLAKHLRRRELRRALFAQGLRQTAVLADRVRRALQLSHLEAHTTRLGLNEVKGIMAGVLGYWSAARAARRSSPGTPT